MTENLKQGSANSHAEIIGQLGNLKIIAVGDIKNVRALNKWMTAVVTAIQKNPDCAPEALKTLKWTWKPKRAAHPEKAWTTMDELKAFVANRRFPRCRD
jgi:aspartate carbamoyltransferase catalytic subunit